MTASSEVIRYGTDSSGRPILMTRYMTDWWAGVIRILGWSPTIIQGAWMGRAGGGAGASDGFHNVGGCLDVRTWDRTAEQQQQLVRVLRRGGAGAWVRTPAQGFDEHLHLVLGTDPGIGADAALQWRNYLAGDAGLSGSQRDYHWRPDPMVTVPPRDYMEDDMPLNDADKAWMRDAVRQEIDAARAEYADAAQSAVWGRGMTVTNNDGLDVKRNAAQVVRETWEKTVKLLNRP